jgi:hypothetical protein
MAQTAAGLSSIAYEVYTGDQLEKQFYEEAPILERFERTNKYTMGREVRVPIWSYNGNGTTVLPAGGGTFNPDDAQDTQVARFTLSYAWQPIGLEFGALNEVHGSPSAAADALTLEVEGAVIGLRRQVMRMAGGGGDGLIAGTLAGGPSTTINLDPAKRGSHAVAAGFLTPGITVDIGTSPNGQSLATARLITDVIESDTAPQIVVSGANITTTGAEFVTLAHPAGAPTEFTGLRSIAGSATSIVGWSTRRWRASGSTSPRSSTPPPPSTASTFRSSCSARSAPRRARPPRGSSARSRRPRTTTACCRRRCTSAAT